MNFVELDATCGICLDSKKQRKRSGVSWPGNKEVEKRCQGQFLRLRDDHGNRRSGVLVRNRMLLPSLLGARQKIPEHGVPVYKSLD